MTPRMSRRRASAFAAIPALSIALAACSGTGTTAAEGEAQTGGELNVGLNSSIACLDPHQNATNVTIFVARNITDSLIDQDPETGDFSPWLASAWTINDDATAFTFDLKPDITFSDGTPLTPEVVKANFDSIVADGPAISPLANNYLAGYAGSTVVDEDTVEVTFSAPNIQFLQGASTVTLGILSPATLEVAPGDRCQGNLAGLGPFDISSFNAQQEVVLSKRSGYNWGSDLREHTGEAHLDTINFRVVPEASVRSGQLRSGELDIDTIPLTENVPTFEDNGFYVVGRPYPGLGVTLIPNLQRPLMQDINVRKAVLQGIDREEIVSGVMTEYDKVPEGLITSVTPLFEPVDGVAYDPEGTKSILEQSGWSLGADGIRVKDGQRLTIVAPFQLASRQSAPAMELVQSQLAEIGIDLQIRPLDAGELTATQTTGDYDLWYTPFHRSEPDAMRSILGQSAQNVGRAPEPRPVDALLNAQFGDPNQDSRKQTVTEADQELIDQAYGIPLFELAGVMTLSDRVGGFAFEASSRLNLYDTWVASS
ncbi:ABC transporter substrate-binding protein [Rhodococcus sp. Eu-32]|uniref:ABC transporter substrate-binding protein n=1 Tax=Rhodococcus sp. Eu-32 TaxID=1017319 RepID=UPI000DF2F461|nr:ABC transporter substrate-binding protein [Rhodococcus sp. Eu-32]RRQ29418.1 ABC transporter substrate-binding protein [Rhodococcus sp. Eu-32]